MIESVCMRGKFEVYGGWTGEREDDCLRLCWGLGTVRGIIVSDAWNSAWEEYLRIWREWDILHN